MVKMEEFMEIFRLKESGYSISAISRLTGVDRKTVRKYLSQGKSVQPRVKRRKSKLSKVQSFESDILNLIKYSDEDFPSCPAIYEKLVERGYRGSLSLVQKWMSHYRCQQKRKIVLRYETFPGQQAQVDWGEKKKRDHRTGQVKKVYIFSMVLSWSRMRFTRLVQKADLYHFLLCHKLAFRYFGGIIREILYDQNRCVLIKPGFKDVVFNQKFLDFAHHYDFVPRLCKPYRAQTKGKVENSIGFIKRNFLALQDTNDVNILNQRVRYWLEKVNHQVHSTTQEIPYKRLSKENLNAVDTLPDYDLYYCEMRRVFRDSTFSFRSVRYSVPPAYVGKTVTIKYKPECSRVTVYWNDREIVQHRTDTGKNYVIKRFHRYAIWKVWRDDQKLFYQKAQQKPTENHPLSIYEEISAQEVTNECTTA